MARVVNGINGPFIGKVGSVIGYTRNGVAYMKGLYKARTKAPGEKEVLNRKKFAAAQAWLKPIIDYVRVGFKGYNERFEGFVAAKSCLMKNALQVIDNEIIIDPALIKISFGNLPLPENIECTIQEPNTLRFTWISSTEKGYGYDQAMVLAYDLKSGKAYGNPYGNHRDSCESVITIGVPKGETYHTYLAFIAADRSRQSESVYLGKFEF